MRMFMRITLPVENVNAAMINGTFPKTVQSILDDLKPEAAFFTEMDGKRTGLIFCDLKEASLIPAMAEPWFLAFNAQVEFHPAMIFEDLKNAAPGIEKAVRNYGCRGGA